MGNYETMRQIIVKEMGTIPQGTVEHRRAAKFLEEIKKDAYRRADGSIDLTEYYTNCRKIEAIVAQDSLATKLRVKGKNNCYIREAKQAPEEIDKQNKSINIRKEDYRNNESMAKAFKKPVSYLYD